MKCVIPLCLTCILKALGIVHNKLLCTEKTKQNKTQIGRWRGRLWMDQSTIKLVDVSYTVIKYMFPPTISCC